MFGSFKVDHHATGIKGDWFCRDEEKVEGKRENGAVYSVPKGIDFLKLFKLHDYFICLYFSVCSQIAYEYAFALA